MTDNLCEKMRVRITGFGPYAGFIGYVLTVEANVVWVRLVRGGILPFSVNEVQADVGTD